MWVTYACVGHVGGDADEFVFVAVFVEGFDAVDVGVFCAVAVVYVGGDVGVCVAGIAVEEAVEAAEFLGWFGDGYLELDVRVGVGV